MGISAGRTVSDRIDAVSGAPLLRMRLPHQVERLPDTADRRITRVRITPEGQRTVSALIDLAREHESRVLEPFGLQQAEALKATLRGMIERGRVGRMAFAKSPPSVADPSLADLHVETP